MRINIGFIKNEKGGSNLISAAVMMPLMVLIIAAIVQITLLVNAKMTVREAAYEALRFGVKSDMPTVTATGTAYKYSNIPGWKKGGNVIVRASLDGNAGERVLNVEVAYKVPVINSSFFAKSRGGFVIVSSGLVKRRLEESL